MRILLTGATGFVGGELAGVLAERGHAVTALVRGPSTLWRNDGRALPCGPSRRPPGIAAETGDVTMPALGLDEPERVSADLLIHCAGLTAFDAPSAAYRSVNVGGTVNVLAFADRAALPVLHVSTAYVCGDRSGRIGEDEIGRTFTNGYERSKTAAERAVRAARARGTRVAVVRPSIVVGTVADGTTRVFGSAYLLLRLMAEGRISKLPVEPGATLDLVPIDYVVDAIAGIAERIDAAEGRTFHLTASAPLGMQTIHDVLAGYFPVPDFVPRREFDPAALPPQERRLHETVVARFAGYLSRNPRFCTDNTRALLGRTCPDLGEPFLRRLVEYALRSEFLGDRGTQRTSG